ncbi:hypothetical protein Zmor_019312 [Zophobas morio]|uniref:Uncharacterized protein n=1 Tax=Zophobas morio TaxID=2755281 RepID=A0AA38I1G5_9CUCU|nr:hypothetical protein Zmor_019312 [Zophobas morio]
MECHPSTRPPLNPDPVKDVHTQKIDAECSRRKSADQRLPVGEAEGGAGGFLWQIVSAKCGWVSVLRMSPLE